MGLQQDTDSDIFTQVETFIQHVRDLDFVVDTESLSRDKDLPDLLAFSMTQWELKKDYSNTVLCLFLIKRAVLLGMIKEGQGLANKFKNCSEENIKLKEELETMSYDLMKAKERIEELEQMFPSAGSEHA